VEAVLGLSTAIGLGVNVQFTATTSFVLINGNSNSTDYHTTTIRATDIPYVTIDPPFTVSGALDVELDLNGLCVIGVRLGSISLDETKHVRISGFHFGC